MWNFIDDRDSVSRNVPSGPVDKARTGEAPKAASAGGSRPAAPGMSFTARDPVYKMENLILPAHVLGQLNTLQNRFDKHALIYDDWGLSEIDPCGKHIAFNLYGPPGTGKTMCVEALAARWGRKIIDVSYAEIESKYVGETGKNITAAFAAAKQQNAVLFFDEADSILGRRMSNVTQAADQAVNVSRAVMLKELDAFDGIVAFATNLSRNFDSAFVRRIPVHVEIPLPDEDGRRKLVLKMVPDKVPFKAKIDVAKIAAATESFSGGDLKNVLVNAISDIASRNYAEISAEEVNAVFMDNVGRVRKAKQEVGTRVRVVSSEDVDLNERQN